jgi:D-alanine-D-alanine ligase
MGGPSAEREVSLRSGVAVAGGLREAGYTVSAVDVAGRTLDVPAGTDAVFIALHGEFGEDGSVQELLDREGIPYTGSGPAASRRAFDKILSKDVFVRAGIPTAGYEVLRAGEARSLALPVVVKPPRQGSSIGVYRVDDEKQWDDALARVLELDDEALVESYLPGRELTVGVVEKEVLPIIQVIAPGDWYDYDAKYAGGQTQYVVPAPVDEACEQACRHEALRVFEALGCRGLGRVDFRVDSEGRAYVLEMNTIPGFTATSLLPKAAASAGIGFPELCGRIMETASLGG